MGKLYSQHMILWYCIFVALPLLSFYSLEVKGDTSPGITPAPPSVPPETKNDNLTEISTHTTPKTISTLIGSNSKMDDPDVLWFLLETVMSPFETDEEDHQGCGLIACSGNCPEETLEVVIDGTKYCLPKEKEEEEY